MKLSARRRLYRPRSYLGLSLHEGSIRVAEVAARERTELVRVAELTYPVGALIETPEVVGKSLKELLVARGFSTTRAIVGVPASRLLTREKEAPPAPPGVVGSALRLAAERDFSIEAKDLALDFAGETDPKEPRKVLLAALLLQHLERVTSMVRAAGLTLDGLTSTTLALAAATDSKAADGAYVVLSPGALEVAAREGGVPKLLKHIPVRREALGGEPSAALRPSLIAAAAEAKRVITLAGGTGDATAASAARVWDLVGLEPPAAADWMARLGIAAESTEAFSIPGLGSRIEPEQDLRPFVAAAALALGGSRREILPFDFIHSRCASAKRKVLDRRAWLGAAAGLALLIGGAVYLRDVEGRATNLASLKDQLAKLDPDVQSAKGFADKVSFVMGWFDTRPPFLACLKQVTLAFPEEGRIWVTGLSANEGRKGVISGKARDQKSILSVLDRLKSDGKLADVKLSDMREAGGTSGEISFALSFTFSGVE